MKISKNITIVTLIIVLISCKTSQKTQFTNETEANNSQLESQDVFEDELEQDYLLDSSYYMDFTHLKSIQTVLLHPTNQELLEPIINLNSSEKLLLSFDELDQSPKNYIYSLVHCNSDWTPSDLFKSEYLKGFDQDYIQNYQSSYNTTQFYTHYQTEIPSQQMKPIYSGNYVIHVFDEENPNQIVLSKRFRIVDNKTNIDGEVKRATDLDQRNYQHEVDFIIHHSNLIVNDPYSDIKVVVTQNNRWDNAITDLLPTFANNGKLIYDQEEDNLFDGGNEYRFFDIKSLRYISERIKNISYENDTNIVELKKDIKRNFQRYSSMRDINGKKLINVQEGSNPSIEADYALVKFQLPYDFKISHGKLYVFGHISDYNFLNTHEVIYDENKKIYHTNIYLKQGYYNYEYVLKKEDGKNINSYIEGTHYETINDYTIYVYYRPVGSDYDQLVGYQKLSSKGLF